MASRWPGSCPAICASVHLDQLPGARARIPADCLLEVRLDRVSPADTGWIEAIRRLPRVIATCRPGLLSQSECADVIRAAIATGIFAVDLDVGCPARSWEAIGAEARKCGTRVIASSHDWEGTPPFDELVARVHRCRATGADLAKIACMARVPEDGHRVRRRYGRVPGPLVAFCMGEAGRFTRVEAGRRGAPFLYASAGPGLETAPGQPTVEEAIRELQGSG